MKSLLAGFLFAAAAAAQTISVGALGGVPFQDAVSAANSGNFSTVSTANNLIIGPSLRFRLPVGFRIEADALYRPLSFNFTNIVNSIATTQSVSTSQWQFPVLIQFAANTPVVKPFLEAGLSFDQLTAVSAAVKSITSGPGQLLHTSNASLILGGGVDVKIPLVTLSGELRFSRATFAEFQGISNLNTAEVLVGVHF